MSGDNQQAILERGESSTTICETTNRLKIESELYSDVKRLAEMTNPLTTVNSNKMGTVSITPRVTLQ